MSTLSANKGTLIVERATADLDGELCTVCGDEVNEGDQIVWEPTPEVIRISPNQVDLAHTACAVRNGYRLDHSVLDASEASEA